MTTYNSDDVTLVYLYSSDCHTYVYSIVEGPKESCFLTVKYVFNHNDYFPIQLQETYMYTGAGDEHV